MAEDKEPYGDVQYADPGYQEDKKKRYPLDSEEHCRAAWSYINMPKNAAKYSSEHLKLIKGRIRAALKRYGADISEDEDSDKRSEQVESSMIETRSAGVDNVDFGQRIITVIAVPYEQPTKVPFQREVWNEVFARSAFNGIEARQRRIPATASLVVPNPNHEQGHLVGRVIEAYPDHEEGLLTDVKISRTERGDETLQLAIDDALSASVGFMVKDPPRDQMLDRGTKTRRITRAFLDHLAFVGEPAYTGARVVGVRSESDLPVIATPQLNDFMNDPIFMWANSRGSALH